MITNNDEYKICEDCVVGFYFYLGHERNQSLRERKSEGKPIAAVIGTNQDSMTLYLHQCDMCRKFTYLEKRYQRYEREC